MKMQEALDNILHAILGKDVRQSLYYGIKQNHEDTEKNGQKIETINSNKIDKPDESDNGLVPRAKDGNVEWVAAGQPTDEQVQTWLDQHPEATTSVQDHSLDINKMVIGTLGYVMPEMFGANGNGVTVDSGSFKNMCDTHDNVLLCEKNTYVVNTEINSKQQISINGNGSVLKNLSEGSYVNTLIFKNCDLVTIENVKFIGNKDSVYSRGLKFVDCKKIIIKDCTFENFSGEPIIIDGVCETFIIENSSLKKSDACIMFGTESSIPTIFNALNCIFAPDTSECISTNYEGYMSESVAEITNCTFYSGNTGGATIGLMAFDKCLVNNSSFFGKGKGESFIGKNGNYTNNTKYFISNSSIKGYATFTNYENDITINNCDITCTDFEKNKGRCIVYDSNISSKNSLSIGQNGEAYNSNLVSESTSLPEGSSFTNCKMEGVIGYTDKKNITINNCDINYKSFPLHNDMYLHYNNGKICYINENKTLDLGSYHICVLQDACSEINFSNNSLAPNEMIIYNDSDSDITLKRNGYNFATIASKNVKRVFAFSSNISVF